MTLNHPEWEFFIKFCTVAHVLTCNNQFFICVICSPKRSESKPVTAAGVVLLQVTQSFFYPTNRLNTNSDIHVQCKTANYLRYLTLTS